MLREQRRRREEFHGRTASWSQAPRLVAASKQVPFLMVGEFGLGGIPTAVGQFSPYRSPGHSERTRRADRASKGERGGDR